MLYKKSLTRFTFADQDNDGHKLRIKHGYLMLPKLRFSQTNFSMH